MTNNNNGVSGSAGGEPASVDMDSLEEMLRKVRKLMLSIHFTLFSVSPHTNFSTQLLLLRFSLDVCGNFENFMGLKYKV